LNKYWTPAKQNDERENEKSRCDHMGNKMVIVDVILFRRSTRKIMSPTPPAVRRFSLEYKLNEGCSKLPEISWNIIATVAFLWDFLS
jgi:hypothetical protein